MNNCCRLHDAEIPINLDTKPKRAFQIIAIYEQKLPFKVIEC